VALKVALQDAVNTRTGKLNLNDFIISLKKGGTSIKQLAKDLESLGPEGEGKQAFISLSNQIVNADTKLFSLSGSLKKMADSLANVAR
jgi:hypothetical protein